MKTSKIIALLAVALVVGLIAYNLVGTTANNTQADFTRASEGTLQLQVTATGVLQPIELVEVGTQVSGIVNKVHVDYNSAVSKGQLLAELDRKNLEQKLSLAQSQYNDAQTALYYQKAIYARNKTLFDDGLISLAEFQEVEFSYKNAVSTVAQRLADVHTEKTNLSFANVYSPIDGVVLSREISEGQTVAATFNTPVLFTIARDLKRMQVEANVDEADIGAVQVGQAISFTVDAHPDEVFAGRVAQVRLNAAINSNVVTYTCILEADNSSGLLMPGMTATISILTKEQAGILLVENKAFSFVPDLPMLNRYIKEKYGKTADIEKLPTVAKKDERIVWVQEQGTIMPKTVQIGISDGIRTEIRAGLKAGTAIMTALVDSKKSTEQRSTNTASKDKQAANE
ncbi:efflux RND transporter periplasmic adaptor subunit [Sphingobacterium bambusae]|uniref:Efflux RND transporter periplasmic adaptor subunit n=1 Tax=Sphingobacterium bambusae TaxID=662858 RepID=A0ABW6BED1_9SPHI|nr:efflux RND transporter periplasmic adaptor subunit [Sphingobacterium bambusae]WPL48597.1 efflux RND transporter periplasmic adaptor subunit [Sphingobacterium bambusae]